MWEEEEIERILFCKNAAKREDKIYLIQIVQGKHEDEWIVKGTWGPRNRHAEPNQSEKKFVCGRLAAEKEFNKIYEAKLKKGYVLGTYEDLPRRWLSYSLTKSLT